MKKHTFSVIAFLIIAYSSYSQIVYVKQNATGLNNGSSWQNAYKDLSTAINSTSSGQIWVSAGTYFPTTDLNEKIPTNPTLMTFKLKPSVAIYGGFSGLETNLNQRNWVDNQTVLSGEIGNPNDLTDNLIHVVSCEYVNLNENTILDGLIITKGYARTTNGSSYGGGIFVYQGLGGSFKMKNCVIKENYSAGHGGGMYISSSNPLIENCIFRNNVAYSGGALEIYYCNATIKECQFIENIATGHALHWGEGGSIKINSYSSPKIINNSFTNNFAQYKGGSVYNSNNYNLSFYNNVVSGNRSREGGALFLDGKSDLINNLLFDNKASWNGGAVFMDYSGWGKFINNTVVQNSAGTSGGGLYIYKPAPEIVNSIFWNNTSPIGSQIRTFNDVVGWTPSFRYCNIQGGLSDIAIYGNAIVYENNLNSNPSFIDASNNNFRLQSNSSLINAGNMTVFPTSWPGVNGETFYFPNNDLQGNQRIVNMIDIGAYEDDSLLGVSQIEKGTFTIYPNPSNGIFNFSSNIEFDSLSIYNIQGAKVFETFSKQGLKTINLIGYPSGLYLFNFSVENKTFSYKVIVQ
ncbi:T9SS type A sorting domain-containing protein [Flavobacterium sp. GNP001]